MPPSHCVVDASVALKWVVTETGSDRAGLLLSCSLHAPDFWRLECANALSRMYRRGFAAAPDVRQLMEDLESCGVISYASETLLDAALSLSITLSHSVYDCLYLALALDQDIPLVTADEKFYNLVKRNAKLKHAVELL